MSDDPHWDGHQQLKNSFPDLDFHLPSKDNENKSAIFLEFHRMVMAQGLVLSESSLSIAASLISNATDIVTFSHSKNKYAFLREGL